MGRIEPKHQELEKLEELEMDQDLLMLEFKKSREQLKQAHEYFNFALDHDQIDHAIFMLNAAEKRFDMLYKLAKKMQISITQLQEGNQS
ncbi:DUF2508 family protein [Paenibacillus sp. N1-5-1-14]|uniref:DUF2508 family protein n=1 Tax=Paenibacillus radicibacter TaxID=2972488 RepID=UPI002159101D|nr:DUF2508 family protein [Paenibacillus radicibacter]MCR8642555.1 DUF2508 family protein [Paenibacillus radicibacter]